MLPVDSALSMNAMIVVSVARRNSMSKTLITSDWHLSARSAYTPEHNSEVYVALTDVITKHRPDNVIIAGDIFHDKSQLTAEVLKTVNQIKALLKDIKVVALQGNHDTVHPGADGLLTVFEDEENWTITRMATLTKDRIGLIAYCQEVSDWPEPPDMIVGHSMPAFTRELKASNNFHMHPNAYEDLWQTKPSCLSVWGHCHLFAYFPPDTVFLGVFVPRLKFDDPIGHYAIYDTEQEQPLTIHKTGLAVKVREQIKREIKKSSLPLPPQKQLTPEVQTEILTAQLQLATEQVARNLKLDPKEGVKLLRACMYETATA